MKIDEKLVLVREQSDDLVEILEKTCSATCECRRCELLSEKAIDTFFFSQAIAFAILGNLRGCATANWELAHDGLAEMELALGKLLHLVTEARKATTKIAKH